jgi:hypothetical protein
MPRRGFHGWAPSKEQERRKQLKEERGHLWTCCRRRAPSAKQAAGGKASGGNCGREAVVIWCRVHGAGGAFVPLCKAHKDLPLDKGAQGWDGARYNPADFQCVPVSEFDEFMRGRAVLAALEKPPAGGDWPTSYLLPKAKR